MKTKVDAASARALRAIMRALPSLSTLDRMKLIAALTNDAPTIASMTTPVHGQRIWRRIGEREHTTRDGRNVRLAVWESRCEVCGEPFQAAMLNGITPAQSKAFELATCKRHRITGVERARLRWSKPGDERRATFEAIRREKLK
jgi:hypothetical protein